MYSLEPTGICLWDTIRISKLIPYEEITGIRKINLWQSMLMGWNPFKPGISETYMGLVGDPLHLMLIETDSARYLLRGEDIDKFIAEANERLRSFRAD